MPNSKWFDDVSVADMRRKTGAKWQRYGDDVLGSWVADMDFQLAPAIHASLREQLQVHDYGYSLQFYERPLRDIFSAWAERRFNWTVDPARIEGLVDIVQGIYLALQLYSEPGDGIVTLTPTYPPLWRSVEAMGRRLQASTLVPGRSGYEVDFDQLQSSIDARTKMLLLCNPHNPTGRVFSRVELEQIAELALQHNLIVLADEIHADLVFEPHRHIPFETLSTEVAARTVTMTSATKSFNLGGLRFAIAIFGSAALQDRFNTLPKGMIGGLNALGIRATEVAWQDCDDWLDGLVSYLQGNRDFVCDQLAARLPQIELRKPEATYLAWLGCQQLPLNQDPFSHFLQAGKVAFNSGPDFGPGGDGFVRLNYATSREILTQIVDQTVASVVS